MKARRPSAAAGPPPSAPAVVRFRLRYAKRGNARFLSHLDVVRAMGRCLRRAQLPLALSGGYNPQPKVAYGTALAFGLESEAEYLDLELARPLAAAEVARRVSREMPAGFELREVRQVPLGRPALQSYPAVTSYLARPGPGVTPPAGLEERVAELLARESVAVVRHGGRAREARRYMVAVEWREGPGEPALGLELASDNRGGGRPDEVLEALGLTPGEWRVLRTDFSPLVAGERTSPWQC